MDGEPAGQRRSGAQDLLQLVSFLGPFKKQMLKALLIIGAINVCSLSMVWTVGKGLNRYAAQLTDPKAAGWAILTFALVYAALGYSRSVLIRFREPTNMKLAMDLLRWLRVRLYSKVQQLSFSYLDRLTSGQIIERSTGDLNQISAFLTNSCFQAFEAVFFGLMAVTFMFGISPKLTLIALGPFPLICFIYYHASKKIRGYNLRVRDEVDVMTSHLSQTIAGSRVIRSFGKQEQEKAGYWAVLQEILRRVKPIFLIRGFQLNGVYVLARMTAPALLLVGGSFIIQQNLADTAAGTTTASALNVGTIFVFMTYVMMLLGRVQALMEMGATSQETRASFERVMALLDAQPDLPEDPAAQPLPQLGGAVTFENVSFAYNEVPPPQADVVERMSLESRRRGPDAVRDVNLQVQPGETIALVGPTGSGKSTIVSLLPRFYDPTEGRVLIDGQDIRLTQLDSLRDNIGLVFQETFLFRGTIAENISYGKPEASREEIQAAARLAQAEEFIRDLPRGYDTEIGERGVSLSGGQRQRLAIARAILKRPRILILDDALAAVDPGTEYRIRRELTRMMRGRTTFVIAHRLATVRAAHRVVVLRDGGVDDVGTHDELAERNEFYRSLCQSQLEPEGPTGDLPPAAGGAK